MILLVKNRLDKTITMQINCTSIIIFIAGAVCSISICYLINLNFWKQTQIRNHMPDIRFIQVRDDFSVYAPQKTQQNEPTENFEYHYQKLNDGASLKQANELDALGSLKLAVEMNSLGKVDKALKLFQHALVLAPKHPEVLIKYGEFLEQSHRDIVRADQMYFQALIMYPKNSEALAHRQRTAQIVDNLDEKRLTDLDQKRDALSSISESNAALRRMKKEAYFQHIYHSVGIEGNTMTLAQTRSILETKMAIDGKSIDEHNEIVGLDSAMKYINATLVNKNDFISLKDILEIHRRVLGHVDPIEGGEFRTTQVYVGGHIPPGPGDLSILMRRFELWLNSESVMSLHPVKYAALAHYKLVRIHPFIDGNGRTSRLLMNTILMRAGYPPVIIPKQQRHKYYEFLQLANNGDVRPFVRFIAECTEKTIDLYLWATSTLPNQIPMLAEQSDMTNSSVMQFDESIGDFIENEGSAEEVA